MKDTKTALEILINNILSDTRHQDYDRVIKLATEYYAIFINFSKNDRNIFQVHYEFAAINPGNFLAGCLFIFDRLFN